MNTDYELAQQLWQDGYQRQMSGAAGGIDEAIQLYQESIMTYPTAEAHTYLGWAYSLKGRFEEAIRECEIAIRLDPDFGNPYNDIGAYILAMDRPLEAIEWFERAIDAPRYDHPAFPHMNIARARLKLGEVYAALSSLRRAFQIDPGYLPAVNAYYDILTKLN
ncbi:MAG: tetratricopeptide repeat protein [Anaerolineales bacterium]|nr:tetratricopeptide repeat protein [Anaerolineales bacterium]